MSAQNTVVRATADNPPGTVGIADVNGGSPVTVFAMPAWKMIFVRVARNYMQVLIGLLTADGIGAVELARGGHFWEHLAAAAYISLAPATIALLQNAAELLTNLDVTKPGLRA